MKRIDLNLKDLVCKTCDNLTYWDGYYCKLGKHQTKKGFLHKGRLLRCDNYIKRIGSNYPACKDTECVFWCRECAAYPQEEEK